MLLKAGHFIGTWDMCLRCPLPPNRSKAFSRLFHTLPVLQRNTACTETLFRQPGQLGVQMVPAETDLSEPRAEPDTLKRFQKQPWNHAYPLTAQDVDQEAISAS